MAATCFGCAKAKRQQHVFGCAKAKRQQHVFGCAKAKRQQHVLAVRKRNVSNMFRLCESEASAQRHDVGHEDVITGCDAFSLRSSIADPQEVAQSPLQSTSLHSIRFNKCQPQPLMISQIK
ncbi:hypothetical protein CWD94_21965 [Lysinibacillus xylanilyticus]|uniref:Uncharacterized protein n=1 Tax=Lysinibacillus xylanilyticus TaxID=582475 RepID=A0A2M9Q0M7_9BACI|nr:hypothetical protein CWD94_21965 [Lysinibacillus xylanilyticus]